MAKDRPEGSPQMAESIQPGTQVKIKWDDANMRSGYANVVHATGTREEIVLLFGMNQAWHSRQKEVTVQLSNRVILNPFAAKRLAILLNNVIRNHEQRFGTLDIEARRPPKPTFH